MNGPTPVKSRPLAGYGATPTGLIEPTTNMITTNMVSALIGALTITAGKVIFNWIPRITRPVNSGLSNMTHMNPPIGPGPVKPGSGRFVVERGGQKMGSAGPSMLGATGDYGHDAFLWWSTSDSYFRQTDTFAE